LHFYDCAGAAIRGKIGVTAATFNPGHDGHDGPAQAKGNYADMTPWVPANHGAPCLIQPERNPFTFRTASYIPYNPLASPVLASNLAGLPPALIFAAEIDALSAEDGQYAKRLSDAGMEVYYELFTGCADGFTHYEPGEAAKDAWMLMAAFLRKHFSYARTEALL
jgi:acetyl esterase/lipase